MNHYLEHGGETAKAEALFGQPLDGWLDLSTGINPCGYPLDDVDLSPLRRLPNLAIMTSLRQAAAAYYGASDPALVSLAPGAQALIQWLPRLRERSRVMVIGPTYGEHTHAWRMAGHDVSETSSLKEIDEPGGLPDVLVCVNPNNPDGRQFNHDHLAKLASSLASRDGWLVVDESFADVVPEISLASLAGLPGLVLLRSFGKFFGLAGLRLGFALAEPGLIQTLNGALGPWAVSGLAATVGARALNDHQWIAKTRRRLKGEALRLGMLLKDFGLAEVGGTDLFCLVQSTSAPEIFARLARHGVLVRKFAEHPQWLRFGLPGGEKEWARLKAALSHK